MGQVLSLHEYELKPGIDEGAFVQAVQRLLRQGLPALPGLTGFHLLKGIKGQRRGHFAALWAYESREAWERLWGAPDQPALPSTYPSSWLSWEKGLSPFLDPEPDRIVFTVYEEFLSE